jgi:hypothetical protein
MRTITLELLRHGPAHNQLLSPLTPYLALCENHDAVTLNVPFEHDQMLHRLNALDYRESNDARAFQLKDIAAVLGDMLGEIPGLAAETNRHSPAVEPLIHLRLMISASELALLPFELALSPPGLPGAGQHMVLQSQRPVCLTREVRRSREDDLSWSARAPRILFVAAAPPQVGEIPVEAHLLALRRAVAPWLWYCDPKDTKTREEKLREHLVFLPNASIEAIEAECAKSQFTHVHFLAHGIEYQDGSDRRYALALHDARDPDKLDRVSGWRLATALRAASKSDRTGRARPAVVTMASCDAGNVGSVVGAGASIAHALHDAGIGVVLAAQFPLSFAGSVRLAEVLYEGLLWGRDPRALIHDLRRRLYSQFPERHDWASLTAYVSLPGDFERQLTQIKLKQVKRSIDATMTFADKAIHDASAASASGRSQTVDTALMERMDAAKQRLRDMIEEIPTEHFELYGLLASMEKKQAEVWFRTVGNKETSKKLLTSSRDHYWQSFQADRKKHWTITQYLSLCAVLNKPGKENSATIRAEKDPANLWSLVRMISLFESVEPDPNARGWAHGTLLELYLISLIREFGFNKNAGEIERLAIEQVESLINTAGADSFEVYSTWRQIVRYTEWYNELTEGQLSPAVLKLAKKVIARFPDGVENWSGK